MQTSPMAWLGAFDKRGVLARLSVLAIAFSASPVCAQQLRMTESAQAASALSPRTSNVDGRSNDWTLLVTPYAWASGIDGTVGVRGQQVDLHLNFIEIVKHLDSAFMLPVEVWHGGWGLGAEVLYIKVSGGKATPGPLFTDANLGSKTLIAELAPRYRVVSNRRAWADVFVGGRYWSLKNTLHLTPGLLPEQTFSLDRHWIDPFLGASGVYNWSSRWSVYARGDAGGFDVGSSFTWQGIGLVNYRATDLITLRAGWRQLDVDFREHNFLYDVGLGGAIVGITFIFGERLRATSADH